MYDIIPNKQAWTPTSAAPQPTPKKSKSKLPWIIGFFIIIIAIGAGVYFAYAKGFIFAPKLENNPVANETPTTPEPPKLVATHMATPTPVRAVYMSSWVAASPTPLKKVLDLIDTTDVNAVVWDIKDATGRISFLVDDPIVASTGSPENRVKNVIEFNNMLHSKGIYVIGRISTFQDPYLTKIKPEWAVMKKSDGTVWKDRKGLSFLDPANPQVWEYTDALARASYNVGFDEINFDYIRYPSDGNVQDIDYKLTTDPVTGITKTRADNLEEFMAFLSKQLRTDLGIKTSADLFGLVTTEKTDMGIGQVLERALPHFDYIGPMVYPSHYAKGEYGIANPAASPYEVVSRALAGAKAKIQKMNADQIAAAMAAGQPTEGIVPIARFEQIRPWLQDFDMGAKYTPELIKAQHKAVYDAGLDSWMMWDPANTYTVGGYVLDTSL